MSLSANYVAANGDAGNPSVDAEAGGGGIGNQFSGATGSVQLAYQQEQWGVAAIWTYLQPETQFVPGTTPLTHSAIDHNIDARTNAYGLSGYWQPLESGWLPSISLGWGINTTSYTSSQPAGSLRTSQSWMVGLQWTDVFIKGMILVLPWANRCLRHPSAKTSALMTATLSGSGGTSFSSLTTSQ